MITDQIKAARQAHVPIVAIETSDQEATVTSIVAKVNGGGGKIQWDLQQGVYGRDDQGGDVAAKIAQQFETKYGSDEDRAVAFLTGSGLMPSRGMAFMSNAQVFLGWNGAPPSALVIQSIANLRDRFKQDGRMLVLLGPDFGSLPVELKNDVLVFSEPLPDEESLAAMVRECYEANDQLESPPDDRQIERCVDAVTGLTAFQAEQIAFMSMRPAGMDMQMLWDQKRALIEQTQGLSVYRGTVKDSAAADGVSEDGIVKAGACETFDDIGGVEQVKQYLRRIVNGRSRPRVIVWLDEVEKTGLAHTGDTSGVNADANGMVLQYMEDTGVYGTMLLGTPGTAKSAIAKACTAEFGVLVVRLDLGAMQAPHVGESQRLLRHAFKILTAVSRDNCMWIATSNSVSGLDAALKSRFTDTFFFDLPTMAERNAIWDIWLKRYGFSPYTGEGRLAKGILDGINDEGWVGRNIRQCVDKAWRMDCSIREAAEYIIPVAESARDDIERLRIEADGKYLNASAPGPYKRDTSHMVKQSGARRGRS